MKTLYALIIFLPVLALACSPTEKQADDCPTAQAYEERLKSVVNDYKDKGLALVAISPNSPLALLY